MKSIKLFILLALPIGLSIYSIGQNTTKNFMIQNFDNGIIELESFSGEDINPTSWELSSTTTFNDSPFSLKLFGNTWKVEDILNCEIDSGDVWQVSAFIESVSEIQGFGIMDENNSLFYSFAGTEELSFNNWMPVYQGCFPEGQWNIYKLPIADDWLSLYGYLPEVDKIVYVNDNDASSPGVVYFDEISDISEDLPNAPKVTIDYSSGSVYHKNDGKKYIDIQFSSEVIDPDSETHNYFWYFGDGAESNEAEPLHTYLIEDDHAYTVLLKVEDPTNKWGRASCQVTIDSGASSFPIKLNFVGDIMLARHFEEPGGIIPTQGVESIFEPTKPYLGDAADITIANLECPLTTHWQSHPTKSICFKGSPNNVNGLTYAGIDIVTLANNHILDFLEPGMEETQSVLDANGIIHSGAGKNSYEAYLPAFYSKSGVNFAFLSASNRTGQYNNYQPYLNSGFNKSGFGNLNEYYLEKQINEVKNISDLVVMEWHCGYEYSTEPHKANLDPNDNMEEEGYNPYSVAPSKSNRSIRQYAIDKGADLVICHHPHITHGLELYNGKLIAHSLGNFIFDLAYPETFPSMILNTSVDERGFYEFTINPVYIDDYIPELAIGELGLHILDDLANRSKELDTYLKVDRENNTAHVIMDTLNMQLDETNYESYTDFSFQNNQWLSNTIELKKSGSITSIEQVSIPGEYEFRLGKEKIWFGNMEDEGCSLWEMDNTNESFCDTTSHRGLRSIQHIREESSPYNLITNFEKRIICRSDTSKFSLAGYIKTQNAKGVTIEVQYYDSRYNYYPIGQENIGILINGDTPWTYYHKELSVPLGTKFFDIRLNSNIPDEGTSYSWFDDVSLIRWNDWEEQELNKSISAPNDYYFLQAKCDQNLGTVCISYTETGYSESQESIEEHESKNINEGTLTQIAPNPFNPYQSHTTFNFNLPTQARINIYITDIYGKTVKTLVDKSYSKGTHSIQWDGKHKNGQIVKPGIYFYIMQYGNTKEVTKCIISHY